MKSLFLLLASSLFMFQFSCTPQRNGGGSTDIGGGKPLPEVKLAESVGQSNAFGIRMFKELASGDAGNMMVSPASALIAMNMILNGADNNTYAQISRALGYPEGTSVTEVNGLYRAFVNALRANNDVEIKIANAIFYRDSYRMHEVYVGQIRDDYDGEVTALDFRDVTNALKTVNGWAAAKTNNKIPKVIDEITPEDRMFLMNAIYFKGIWTVQFKKESTRDMPFTLADGSVIQVPTMRGEIPLKQADGNGFTAFELPFGKENFVIDFLVPTGSLSDLVKKFSSDDWQAVVNNLESQEDYFQDDILVPKFRFSYEKELNRMFQQMGVTDAFNEQKADFGKLSEEPVFLGFIKQNTFVEVNEEGAEAAAVTTGGFRTTSVREPLHINKPFIFAIRERASNALLFIGQVTNPAK